MFSKRLTDKVYQEIVLFDSNQFLCIVLGGNMQGRLIGVLGWCKVGHEVLPCT